jgi:hypothetical protein
MRLEADPDPVRVRAAHVTDADIFDTEHYLCASTTSEEAA